MVYTKDGVAAWHKFIVVPLCLKLFLRIDRSVERERILVSGCQSKRKSASLNTKIITVCVAAVFLRPDIVLVKVFDGRTE